MAVLPKGDADDDSNWSDDDRYGSVESAPLLVTLVLPIIIGAILLLKCVFSHCCMRQTPAKEEMFGIEGRVTALSPDEPVIVLSAVPLSSSNNGLNSTQYQNHSVPAQTTKREHGDWLKEQLATESSGMQRHSSRSSSLIIGKESKPNDKTALTTVASAPMTMSNGPGSSEDTKAETTAKFSSGDVDYDYTDSLKRSTLHRELPDPPNVNGQRTAQRSNSVLSHDGTSELYATVGEVPNPSSTAGKLQNGETHYDRPGPSDKAFHGKSQSSSKSDGMTKRLTEKQADTTISSDSETYGNNPSTHPYAKLKRVTAEHPYARVRPTSGAVGDEETDTDNYDTPQPYAQTTSRPGNSRTAVTTRSAHSNRETGLREASNAGEASAGVVANGQSENPVPPRRAARLWLRGNPSGAESQQQFSGDSQDSRGYTSISVREPLSNIINKRGDGAPRQYDGLYATVSDDSEEMYAAIEDADGNYMRIPEVDGEGNLRHWAYPVPNVASPIPERREANSPLPPPPIPQVTGQPDCLASPASAEADVVGTHPPVYAQVTKKNKKTKPLSSAAISSQDGLVSSTVSVSSHSPNSTNEIRGSNPELPKIVETESHASTIAHSKISTVETSKSTVSNTTDSATASISTSVIEITSEPRRWSKADISFSEFEIVREPLYCTPDQKIVAEKRNRKQRNSKHLDLAGDAEILKVAARGNGFNVVDDENYNVIPERPTNIVIVSDHNSNPASGTSTTGIEASFKDSSFEPRSNHNYQEIKAEEISDYYQEIGPRSNVSSRNLSRAEALYHQIDAPPRRVGDRDEIEDEEQGDEFYETVKPARKHDASEHPAVGSAAEERYNRKHGYEKLKKKPSNNPMVVAPPSDDDDDDEDDDDDDNGTPRMYEKLKYPPYDRLKESRDDLSTVSGGEDNDRNFYETIGYSRTTTKEGNTTAGSSSVQSYSGLAPKNSRDRKSGKSSSRAKAEESVEIDVDQLYARVDKSRKKKGDVSADERQSKAKMNPNSLRLNTAASISTRVTGSSDDVAAVQGCIVLRQDHENDDSSIEYI